MEFIRFEELPAKSGKLGLITLTRCKALNALTLEMIQALAQQLIAWASNDDIFAVVINSECEKAFCAGGDIRALYEGRNNTAEQLQFFYHEYQLNYMIGTYEKPIVALLNGIVMGGGAGISTHASHRVANETFIFAMPETMIGLFPDIGASSFLNKSPGELGRYLALSGARINVADGIYAGLVDYYISSNHYPAVIKELTEVTLSVGTAHEKISEVLAGFAIEADESIFKAKQDFIDGIFCADQVSTMLEYLKHDDSEWSQAVLSHLMQRSPMSLSVTLEAMRRADGKDLAFCLQQDFCLIQSFLRNDDLYEGIRAVVIDKDMLPVWQPASLSAIRDDQVDAYFDETDKQKLVL